MRAFWNYFVTINAVNLPVSICIGLFAGMQWLLISLFSFGLFMGLIAYQILYKNQYYFYFNLGYTRLKLAVMVFIVNFIISAPLLTLISII